MNVSLGPLQEKIIKLLNSRGFISVKEVALELQLPQPYKRSRLVSIRRSIKSLIALGYGRCGVLNLGNGSWELCFWLPDYPAPPRQKTISVSNTIGYAIRLLKVMQIDLLKGKSVNSELVVPYVIFTKSLNKVIASKNDISIHDSRIPVAVHRTTKQLISTGLIERVTFNNAKYIRIKKGD